MEQVSMDKTMKKRKQLLAVAAVVVAVEGVLKVTRMLTMSYEGKLVAVDVIVGEKVQVSLYRADQLVVRRLRLCNIFRHRSRCQRR